MEAFLELHGIIMFYLVIIIFIIGLTLFKGSKPEISIKSKNTDKSETNQTPKKKSRYKPVSELTEEEHKKRKDRAAKDRNKDIEKRRARDREYKKKSLAKKKANGYTPSEIEKAKAADANKRYYDKLKYDPIRYEAKKADTRERNKRNYHLKKIEHIKHDDYFLDCYIEK